MKKTRDKNLTSFEDHLDQQYGKRGPPEREKFEEGFETFKPGVMIQELRRERGLTQKQLARKYIKGMTSLLCESSISSFPTCGRQGWLI